MPDLFDWQPPPRRKSMKDMLADEPYELPTPPKAKAFNGPDYVPERDHARLTGQIERVFDVMRDGRWRTLDQIGEETGDPVASISAQLRHLRKARWGSHTIDKEHQGNGLYLYRLIVNETGRTP